MKAGHGASGATATRELADFVSGLTYESLPPAVVEQAKLIVLDGLGCGLHGSTLPWTKLLLDSIAPIAGSGPATVVGTGRKLDPAHAALVNGSAIHGFELDDFHGAGMIHLASVAVPGILGLAQQRGGVGGRDLILGVVAGGEVGPRLGRCFGQRHLVQGWHAASTNGSFAAAAAVGRALRLDAHGVNMAFGLAGSQTAGLIGVQYGAMAKRLHSGLAAQRGFYAGVLAGSGYTGIEDVFDLEYGGYLVTFAGSPDAFDRSQLTKGLGTDWETSRVGIKPYSCNGSIHTSLDAMRHFRQTADLRADDVQGVTIHVSKATLEHVGWPYEPGSVTTAQFNLGYCVAVMLREGDCFIDQFDESRLNDPRIVDLARRVHCVHDPAVDARGNANRHNIRVEVALRDGRQLLTEVLHRRGSEVHPLSPEEVREKFDKLARTALPPERVASLAALVARLEALPDVAALARELEP